MQVPSIMDWDRHTTDLSLAIEFTRQVVILLAIYPRVQSTSATTRSIVFCMGLGALDCKVYALIKSTAKVGASACLSALA